MRSFIGVPLPPLPDLATLLGELQSSGADLKAVRADQLHLTLKFLGEVPEDNVERLRAVLRGIPFPAPFPLVLEDVGAFPDWRKLNVLWAGVLDPTGAFGRAFMEVEKSFGALGFEPEGRAFHPHLTLARKRSDRGRDSAKQVLERWRGHRFGEATVSTIRFYESTLTPQGPVYQPLEEVVLA